MPRAEPTIYLAVITSSVGNGLTRNAKRKLPRHFSSPFLFSSFPSILSFSHRDQFNITSSPSFFFHCLFHLSLRKNIGVRCFPSRLVLSTSIERDRENCSFFFSKKSLSFNKLSRKMVINVERIFEDSPRYLSKGTKITMKISFVLQKSPRNFHPL